MSFFVPESGIVGTMKKSVRKRIPVFSMNCETTPHCEQRIISPVCCPPQVKNFVPMIKNISEKILPQSAPIPNKIIIVLTFHSRRQDFLFDSDKVCRLFAGFARFRQLFDSSFLPCFCYLKIVSASPSATKSRWIKILHFGRLFFRFGNSKLSAFRMYFSAKSFLPKCAAARANLL